MLQTFHQDVRSYDSSLSETKGYVWACTQTEICIHECTHIKMQGIFRDLLRYKVQEQFKKGEIYHHEG